MNRLLSTLALALFALDCAAIELGVAGTFDVDTADIAITPGVPAGYVSGNGVFLMGHVLEADGGTEDVNTPMGWTELVSHEVQSSGFNSTRTTVFCKVPGESESSPSVTTANATSANNHGATIVWYEDALADCSMVVNTSGNAGANEANLSHAGLTIADADLLFVLFGGKRGVNGNAATVDALTTDSLSWNRIEKNGTAVGNDLLLVIDDVIPGDADNLSSGSWNISAGDSSARGASVALALEPSAASSWTVEPSVTDRTDSSFTVTFTTDIDTTVYGVACPIDSDPLTAAQVIAGDCADDSAANATCTEATTGGVSDQCVLTPSDSPPFPAYDLAFVGDP